MTNAKEGGEMFANGEGTIHTPESPPALQSLHRQPAGKGEEGVIHTEPLKASTKGQGDELKFEPDEGTIFARFNLVGAPTRHQRHILRDRQYEKDLN